MVINPNSCTVLRYSYKVDTTIFNIYLIPGSQRLLKVLSWISEAFKGDIPGSQRLLKAICLGPRGFGSRYTGVPEAFKVAIPGSRRLLKSQYLGLRGF